MRSRVKDSVGSKFNYLLQVGQSNAHQVVIRDVQLEVAGKYRCEVSADAPTFHTDVVSSYMHVVCKYRHVTFTAFR